MGRDGGREGRGADRVRDGRGGEAVEQVGRGRQGGRPEQAWWNQERWKRHGNNSGCCQGWPGGLRHSLQWVGGEFGKACTAAGTAAMTYMNIQSLGAKGLVKK